MHYILSWQYLLPYCSAAAALVLSIHLCVCLNRKIARMSEYQKRLMAASPATCNHMQTLQAIRGKSPGISTPLNRQIRLPVYPQHRAWKSKGAKYGSTWRSRKMFRTKLLTLYHIMKLRKAHQRGTAKRATKNKSSRVSALKEV